VWRDKVSFNDIRQAWSNVAKRILQEKSSLDKIGIYVHIPFCKTKCLYCCCFSFQEVNEEQHSLYLDCLENEIKLLNFPKQIKIKTVYIAGGTPSILSSKNLERLFRSLYKYFNLDSCGQITIEINPYTVTLKKIKVLKDFGVDRITIGIQTLNESVLKKLDRPQYKKSVFRSYDNIRKAGIKYINVDLMAGLPGQTLNSFTRTLEETLRLKPDTIHINPFYPVSSTPFFLNGKRLKFADIMNRIELIRLAYRMIAQRYPSAFERDGLEKENMQYYNFKKFNSSILGLGYGALSHANHNLHYGKFSDFKLYIKILKKNNFPYLIGHKLNKETEMRAYVIANLENNSCVSKELFYQLFRKSIDEVFREEIRFLIGKGKLEKDDTYIKIVPDNKIELFIYTKLFYDRIILERFRKLIRMRKKEYNNLDLDLLSLYDV